MCVCIYIYLRPYDEWRLLLGTDTKQPYLCTALYTYVYIYIYIYVCVYVYVCMYIYIYAYIYIHVYAYIYIYIYIYIGNEFMTSAQTKKIFTHGKKSATAITVEVFAKSNISQEEYAHNESRRDNTNRKYTNPSE